MSAGNLPLAGLRVLDLSGEAAPLCGQMLALLGATVLLPEAEPIVPPHIRTIESLQWMAYNAGKRRIDIDRTTDEGRAALRRLIEHCDVLIDDGNDVTDAPPRSLNPALVHVSVTPFGMTGPRAGWQGSELIAQASGGLLYLSGSRQFPPAMLGIPIARCSAGAQAAVATLLALRRRQETGEGARIDQSTQEAVASILFKAQSQGHVGPEPDSRGEMPTGRGIVRRALWPCKDGYLTWTLWTGTGWGRKNFPLIDWMVEEGDEAGPALKAVPWEELSLMSLDPGQLADWHEQFARFFERFPKKRLADEAAERRILLYPVNDMGDVAADPQLHARDVFVPLRLGDGTQARAMGSPFESTAYDVRLRGPESTPLASVNAILEQWRAPPPAPADRGVAGARLPLEGVRVLDFGWAVVAPVTTKYLAMFGADVVKLEARKRPDASRMTGPYPLGRPGMDGSATFANHNCAKRSVGIDVAHPMARELLLRMAKTADIVVENFSPGVMERHGLTYDAFRSARPGIIMLRLSLQGQTGPRAMQPGLGNHVQALCGLDSICGFPEGPPGGPNQVLPDLIGPWFAISAVLAALEHRRATGEGQEIDLSQYEAALMFLQPALLAYETTGKPPERRGNSSERACPHGVYPVVGNDAWIAIAVTTDEQWRRFRSMLPEAIRERFVESSALTERRAQAKELDAAIAAWTADQDGGALAGRLQAAGIAAYVVNNGVQLLHDPQLVARGHYTWAPHEVIGEVPVDGPAFRIEGMTPRMSAGPRYATGTSQVLREWLNAGDDEMAELLAAGAIDAE